MINRNPIRLETRNILAPPSAKITELEVKNSRKNAEEAKAEN